MKNAVSGINFNDDDAEIKNCETCVRGQQTREKFEKSDSKTNEILELIHSDLMGPMETPSMRGGGAKYILIFLDDFSRKVFVFLSRLEV